MSSVRTRRPLVLDGSRLERIYGGINQGVSTSELEDSIKSAQRNLTVAQETMKRLNDRPGVWRLKKKVFNDLMAPATAVITILETLGEIHVSVKAVSIAVKFVVDLEMKRRENDKQIVVLYHTMSSFFLILSLITPVVTRQDGLKSQFDQCITQAIETITKFGNFSHVYYKHKSTATRIFLSQRHKDELLNIGSSFDEQKQHLNLLVQMRTSLVTTEMDRKVDTLQATLDRFTAPTNANQSKEQNTLQYITSVGGWDRINNDRALKQIATQFGDEICASVKYVIRTDINKMLETNMGLFTMKIEHIQQSTREILQKLDEGPYQMIEDADMKVIWRSFGSRTSAKCRSFIDAMQHHFRQKFAKYHSEIGAPHQDAWTLRFMSRVIFYPAIGDAIDEDSSGYVSIHEVNEFMKARPKGWTTPQWIAYWAIGPYKSDLEYQTEIVDLMKELQNAPETSLPENRKGVQNLAEVVEELGLIRVYKGLLNFYGESEEDQDYAKLEGRRHIWRDMEETRLKKNLVRAKFRLDGAVSVSTITNGHRLEHSIFCLIYLLLVRHLKIVRYAATNRVSMLEFEDMWNTWECLLDAFESRLNTLLEVWRQQRLDVKKQLECYSGGLFEVWEKKRNETPNLFESTVDLFNSDEEDEEGEDGSNSGKGPAIGKVYEGEDYDDDDILSIASEDAESLLLYPVPPMSDDGYVMADVKDMSLGKETLKLGKREAYETLSDEVAHIKNKLCDIEGLLRRLADMAHA